MPGKKNLTIRKIKLPLLGIHNIRNSTAAIAVAVTIGISQNIIKKGLKEFKGVQRRFNKIFTHRETNFYDDYAHHPTEIREVLNGVRAAYKKEEVICIFQPHRISRLKDLKKEFSLSGYIEAYPSMSKSVEMSLRMIINDIKRIKKSGGEFTDIQDHPMVKNHLKDLEKFI